MLLGHLGEDLAIQLDVGLLEGIRQAGVGDAELAGGGVDAHLPEFANLALVGLAIASGILTGLDRSGLGKLDLALATPHHALGTGQQVLASLEMGFSALYTWHSLIGSDRLGNHPLDGLGEGSRHLAIAALHTGNFAGFTAVVVVLASGALNDFTGLGNLEALGHRVVHLHIKLVSGGTSGGAGTPIICCLANIMPFL